jgi:hypothetical protein
MAMAERQNCLVHNDFGRPTRGRGPTDDPSWRLRALQVGVAVFASALLVSFVGLMMR